MKTYTEERLIEIVVGILANIFCANCPKTISDEEITAIFSLLNCDDPLILLQVVRFVKALSVHDESLTFLNREMVEKFTFILANSLNSALLTNCLDALAALCSHDEFIRWEIVLYVRWIRTKFRKSIKRKKKSWLRIPSKKKTEYLLF